MKCVPAGSCVMVRLVATMLLVAPLQILLAARQEDACRFPGKWQGTWFQSGFRQPITIEGSRLSTKGQCLSAEGDKFIVVDEKGCYRCVVIHEKHANVLQYKETYCHTKDNLSTLCSLITGDALLFSMFRIEATPVSCPFKGPGFTFTYNRGHGDCRSPVSSIDSCTEESRLLLRYQACPDVHGTESTVEELQCLATWKEGSSRYLVGKVTHNHATSNEDRYRCFVYEKATLNNEGPKGQQEYGQPDEVKEELGVDYRVAQSGDATCNGLSSPMEGSRTMTLKRAPAPNKCRFPTWLTASPHWHTLDYTRVYSFHHHNTTLRIANTSTPQQQQQQQASAALSLAVTTSNEDSQPEMRVSCSVVKQATHDVVTVVTHFTMGCQSGFVCMVFYRRDGHVIEVQTGGHVRRAEDACHATHFNRTLQPFVTLVTSSPEPRQCPYLGKFSVTGVTRDDDHLFRSTRSMSHDRSLSKPQNMDAIVKSRTLQRFHRSASEVARESNDVDEKEQPGVADKERPELAVAPQSHEKFYEDVPKRLSAGLKHVRRARSNRDRDRDLDSLSSDPCGGDADDFTTLVVGCSTMDTMEFRSECMTTDVVSAYSCHGRWEDNGTHYLITTPLSRSSHGARRYCFMYREIDGVVHFSSSSDSCQRDISPGVGGALAFNVTSSGQCVEANGASRNLNSYYLIAIFIALIAASNLLEVPSHYVER